MPGDKYRSIQNPPMYRAIRRRGLSKQSAARISNARTSGHQVKESATADLATPPHGPQALFNQPGVGSARRRRKRLRTKALNWGARGGQTIGGRLRRGSDGRFSGDGSGASSDTPRQQRSRARRDARRQRLDELRAAREQERSDEEAKRAEEDAYIAGGKTGRERQRRRTEVAQARRDRAKARRDLHQRQFEEERAKRDEEDAAEEEARAQDKKGGGGGGKKKPSAEAERKAAANRAATAPKAGLSTAEAETLAAVAEDGSTSTSDTRRLRAMGLMDDTGATDAGRRLLAALERGDVRGALAAIQDGKARVAREQARSERTARRQADARRRAADRARQEAAHKRREQQQQAAARRAERERNQTLSAQIIRNLSERRQRRHKAQATFGGKKRADLPDSVFAGPDRSFPIVTAQDVRDAVRSLGRTKHGRAAVRRGIIRRARAIGATGALPESWRAEKEASAFAVFKDARGADRWLAITTTAYEDKDAEWITCKAIRGVVAAGDAAPAARGPLRFWHVPGLDLGDCDYQASAFGDRFLIESGTFRSKAAARIGRTAAARGYQMSPGFLTSHWESERGVFDHIVIVERSFLPPGRASNPYTRLLTKGDRMLTDEKRKEFESLAGDADGRALLAQLLTQTQAQVKEADTAGVVYKDAPEWAQALIARIDALEAHEKAAPPTEEPAPETGVEGDLGDADLAALDEGGDNPDAAGDMMDDEGFADLIVQKLVAALGPMLDLEKKMTGYLGEMKAMLAPAQQKDDTRAREIADLQARLKELEGGQPRARTSLASGLWGGLTGVEVTKEQADKLKVKAALEAAPAGLSGAEADAYKLIFGDS